MTKPNLPAQLSLPLQAATVPTLSKPEHQAAIAALAQLLLTAATQQRGRSDE